MESVFVLNAGPKEFVASFAGYDFRFPPGKITEIPTIRVPGAEAHPAYQIWMHIESKIPCSALVVYDFDERDSVGKDDYNKAKRVEAYTKHMTAIDAMIEDHNRMNDELVQRKQSTRFPGVDLRDLIATRKKYEEALTSAGSDVWSMPTVSLPEISVQPITVPIPSGKKRTLVTDESGSIDPESDHEPAKPRAFRGGRKNKPEDILRDFGVEQESV
jgi:hypothetical protein